MRAGFRIVGGACAVGGVIVLLWLASQRAIDSRRALDLASTRSAHWAAWGVVGAAGLVGYAASRLTCSHQRWAVALTIAAVVVASGALFFDGMRGNARDYVSHYCSYGARSGRQLATCKTHVRPRDVDRLHTRAARFARGEVRQCHRDAGPYCVADY